MLARTPTPPRPPSLLKRIADAIARPPPARPFSEMGVAGTAVYSGYVQTRERSPKWTGSQRYVTIADMAVNTSIIAAGVHYFLNLIAHPQWTIAPADESDEARAVAELVEESLHGMDAPWSGIVRRAGTYRFYGFGIQEWTARPRARRQIGQGSNVARPLHTIEQWVVADDGTIEGVWQRSPKTGALLGIPRSKFLYLVEDALTDSPEGTGLFRHLAEPWERLKIYYDLEARAFERDLRGIPVGRVPYTLISEAVKDNTLTQAQANTLVKGMEDFVQQQVKQSDTSITLDSIPYYSQAADGAKVAGLPQWGVELLQGSATGVEAVSAAITRTQTEMARILTVEHLMMGESSGNRSLGEDKSRNLYLVANSVLGDIAAGADHDVVAPLCRLNGIPEELWPHCEVEDVAFKDAESVASTLAKMAQAGAVLAPDDPVIEDVRGLMGVSAPSPVSPEMAGLPTAPDVGAEEEAAAAAAVAKMAENQPRVPAGSSEGGQFESSSGGGQLTLAVGDRGDWPAHVQALRVPPAWTDVQYSEDPSAALQAVGRDSKGRSQYIYHPDFVESQAAAKFSRIRELDNKFERIQEEVVGHTRSRDPVLREHADAMRLIMTTGLRPGSEEDTGAAIRAYGATTLEGQHVKVSGGAVTLAFVGKKGVALNIPVEDRAVARMLSARARAAGPDGQLFPEVSRASLGEYTRGLDGGGFKTKDFRTALGTRTARSLVSSLPRPSTTAAYKKAVRAVASAVSARLGNTITVALQSYIDPTVFAPWRSAGG